MQVQWVVFVLVSHIYVDKCITAQFVETLYQPHEETPLVSNSMMISERHEI